MPGHGFDVVDPAEVSCLTTYALHQRVEAAIEIGGSLMSSKRELKPKSGVRRFDVFAEYTRQEREQKGYPEDEAKGYGIWLAKVVAARRFGQQGKGEGSKARRKLDAAGGDEAEEPKFRSVGDELQTDELFDRDIIGRMGARFYDEVFAPAITEARNEGKSYETIRDAIRQDWKPVKRGGERSEGG